MENTETKKVRIKLAALTRMEYEEVLEVPADMTDAELDSLVNQRYDDVDGGEYADDPEYWERSSSCGYEAADEEGDEVTGKVNRKSDGRLTVSKVGK
jgi:hypothetical protein